ncbi:MAG: D-2-hydroxyacid dehydrogenase [Desulfobacteraceae bacterium]
MEIRHIMGQYQKDRLKWIYDISEQSNILEQAEIIFTYKVSISQLQKAKNLKWIQLSSSGWEHIPATKLKDSGIIVTNAAGVGDTEVAHYILTAVLMLSRNMHTVFRNQLNKHWEKIPATSLLGKNILFLGTGRFCQEAARLLSSFQVNCFAINRSGQCRGSFSNVWTINKLHELLPKADYLINALPVTTKTRNIIGREEINLLKQSCSLIQIGRAATVDETALYKALSTKSISKALIDVYWQEPLTPEQKWYSLENVILTPHMASLTEDYNRQITELFFKNINQYLKGADLINRII